MTTTPLPIHVAGLTKSFGKKDVLRGVDLDVPPGSIVGLLGLNGSGKSTLIKTLVGLLQATSGEARVFGEDPWELSLETKRRVGYVPQEVRVAPWMSIAEVVRYTAAFFEDAWNHTWAESLVDRFRLERTDRAGTLSGGQTQKLGLVLALGHRPELLLLDEPVAALDPIARRELLATLVELTDETNASDRPQTVLFSTHITADLERVASHVALLKEGRVSLFEEMDSLKESIQRVRIVSSEPLASNAPSAASTTFSADARTVSATLTSQDITGWESWATEQGADFSVDPMNLEDLFVELHGEANAAAEVIS